MFVQNQTKNTKQILKERDLQVENCQRRERYQLAQFLTIVVIIALTISFEKTCLLLFSDSRTQKNTTFVPFKGCTRAVKKLSQHLQYRHPHLTAQDRRHITQRAQVAPGMGARKPVPITSKQPTLVQVVGELESEEEDLGGNLGELDSGGVLEYEGEDVGENMDLEGEGGEDMDREGERVEDMDQEGEGGEDMDPEGEGGEEMVGWGQEVEERATMSIAVLDEQPTGEESSIEVIYDMEEVFPPDHPFLVCLREYLVLKHGKGRSIQEANQISAQVLKYLRFASLTLQPAHLYNPQILNHYMKTLDDQGKKPSTQHGILCRLEQGLTYVNLTLDHQETVKAEKCSQLISHWLSTLGKEAKRVKQKISLTNWRPISLRSIVSQRHRP